MESSPAKSDDFMEDNFEEIIRDPCCSRNVPFIPPTQRIDAPLAGILKPELASIDPRRYFPDFKPDGILRFSRVFAANSKPTLRNQIWWSSKTFNKESQNRKVVEADVAGTSNDIKNSDKWALKIGAPPKAEECMVDDNDLLCAPGDPFEKTDKIEQNSDDEDDAAPWRFGPAQMWYDRMGVPTNSKKFDYGFRLKQNDKPGTSQSEQTNAIKTNDSSPASDSNPRVYSEEDKFLPVNLVHWEDDIIIDGEEARKKIIADFANKKLPRCGWIPTAQTRTYTSFVTAFQQGTFQQMFSQPGVYQRQLASNGSETSKITIDANHSIFPMDNYEFETTRWEDLIIWDADQMPFIPEPRVLTLDYEDDPTIFGIPEDINMDGKDAVHASKQAFRKDNQFTKRSEMVLLQVQRRQKQEEAEQHESNIARIADKDPFNLSNDDYYYAVKNISRNSISAGALNRIIQIPKRVVTGTNADLRKLPLKEAKEICREYGLREEELNSLSRWDIIHVIRTLSTQAAKVRPDFTGMARFARGNIRHNLAEISETQNKTLCNIENACADENSSVGKGDLHNENGKLESVASKSKVEIQRSDLQRKQKPKKPRVEKKSQPPPKASLLKMRCSACGETGHMKTNKYCRLYGQKDVSPVMKTVGDICATTIDEEELDVPTEGLIAIEGTRLKISKKLYRHVEQERNKKKALRLHIPKQFLNKRI